MGIKFFYNISLKEFDNIDFSSDIFSEIRKAYFENFEKQKGKLAQNSSSNPLFYDYCMEEGKPLKWLVTDKSGKVVQNVVELDGGRYYVCYYENGRFFKRILFSKLHTLLSVEYYSKDNEVVCSLEPRRSPFGLCILMKFAKANSSYILYSMPDIYNDELKDYADKNFDNYFVKAYTNEGVVKFILDEQKDELDKFLTEAQIELQKSEKLNDILLEDSPLASKINPKDFNTKRNLYSSIDITKAKDFLSDYEINTQDASDKILDLEDEYDKETLLEQTSEILRVETNSLSNEQAERKSYDIINNIDVFQSATKSSLSPDKIIRSMNNEYLYYGSLDENQNRTGYGRTVTSDGKTAYEGQYINDKRSGYGAYYYKDGTLCYYGEWNDNNRSGVGVGVSSTNGSIHVGSWEDNKPFGDGVRLHKNGELEFVCHKLSDNTTLLINFLSDDNIIVSKYDENGNKLSDKDFDLNNILNNM